MNNYNPSIYRVICIVTFWFFESKKNAKQLGVDDFGGSGIRINGFFS